MLCGLIYTNKYIFTISVIKIFFSKNNADVTPTYQLLSILLSFISFSEKYFIVSTKLIERTFFLFQLKMSIVYRF